MKKIKFSQIKHKIVNNPGFRSLKEIKEAGYRIVKERDGDRYFLAKKEDLKPLLVRLGDVAEVNEGRPTGANDYFFIPFKRAKEYKIEKEFLLPGIMKTRDMNYFIIDSNMINRYFLQI